MRSSIVVACVLGIAFPAMPPAVQAQTRLASQPKFQAPPSNLAEPMPVVAARPSNLFAEITLADIGFANGIRFANLGGRRELFVPVPQAPDIEASELVLVLDDVSAHDARRNLEVHVNDRTAVALVLDGKSHGRSVRVPLGKVAPKDGYLKLTFVYSGAATLDRCIDVRYVGDSLTTRPETAVAVDVGGAIDVATTAALMPREVAIVLPGRRLSTSEIATAVTVGRSVIASGRQVVFQRGYESARDLARRGDGGRWARGLILIGTLADAAAVADAPLATVAGPLPSLGTLAAIRIGGTPALLVSDSAVVRAGRLLADRWLPATRGIALASVGDISPMALPTDRVSFDQLGIAPAEAEVFGRAELAAVIDTRRLAVGTRPARLLLDVMVAPDGAGARAVVSAFVNDRLLGSTVAASGEATHLDLPLPEGLVGTNANIRAVVQRDSAQGDCRFEPQGYPAQILGSSSLVLDHADGVAHDFSDLVTRWSDGLELLLPAASVDQPTQVLGLVSEVLNQLSSASAPVNVALTAPGTAPAPHASFLAVRDRPPEGASAPVRFDRGRVAVTDRAGHTLLDLGGFATGAVAQIVSIGDEAGLWIKPLAGDGTAPAPTDLRLDHGDVAFVDATGVALAMSTERDSVIRISYPDQVSWLTVADRFRSWIIAGVWLLATAVVLLVLQRMFRRAPADAGE